jgi:hypothetical protein
VHVRSSRGRQISNFRHRSQGRTHRSRPRSAGAAFAIRRHVQRGREADACRGALAFAQKSISGAASNADNFEKLQIVPLLILTPLTFLGGTFYSTSVLPPFWRTVTLFNPLVYLISGFRWSFFDIADVHIGWSAAMTLLAVCKAIVFLVLQDRLSADESVRRARL